MEQVEPVEDTISARKVHGMSAAIVLFREPEGHYSIVGGEPVFLLRAQDITADLVVDFWTILNGRLNEMVKGLGMTPADAVERLREVHHIPYPFEGLTNVEKHKTAVKISKAMRAFAGRKVAD